jgi:hypothetical protein
MGTNIDQFRNSKRQSLRSSTEVENILQEYWVLDKLDELALVYIEIKNHLDLFLNLFHIMRKNKLINQKDIKTI